MPSPFPGMDPYLENPRLWQGLHNRLIQFMARAINDALPKGCFADTNERVYISGPLRSIVPDVLVLERGRDQNQPQRYDASGATLLEDPASATDTPFYVTLRDAVHEPYIEIFAVGAEERVSRC